MINIEDYKQLKLEDVAEYERSREGKIYPKGCTLIQLSATSGQVEYLEEDEEVDRKYAVVIPDKEINSQYFNLIVKKNINNFISKYQAGMNIQIGDLKNMNIQLHNKETQEMIAFHINGIEQKEKATKIQISILQTLKNRFLRDLFM